MRLIPHEWRHLDNWRREMERFVEPLFQSFNTPRVDLFETDSELVAVCEIPGIEKKEDIHVDVSDNVLIISGSVRRWGEVKDDAFHRRERYAAISPVPSDCRCPSRAMKSKPLTATGCWKCACPKPNKLQPGESISNSTKPELFPPRGIAGPGSMTRPFF